MQGPNAEPYFQSLVRSDIFFLMLNDDKWHSYLMLLITLVRGAIWIGPLHFKRQNKMGHKNTLDILQNEKYLTPVSSA